MDNRFACSAPDTANRSTTDVIIVGGGIAGTLAGILLARASVRTTVIDPHEVHPADFGAEQVVGDQVTALARLGLLDILVGDCMPVPLAVGSRRGRIIGRVTSPHYGMRYEDMVNHARRGMPPDLTFIKGKVVDIGLSADHQAVLLSDGAAHSARLIVLATGLGRRLLTKCGIKRDSISPAHSLTFGFDIRAERLELFQNTVQVAYGELRAIGIDYLTVFPIGNTLRGNLFTFGNVRDTFTRRMIAQPTEALRGALPGMQRLWGALEVTSHVDLRVNELSVATDVRRNGVLLIGDAFQSSCPAAGTGIGRLLNDIDLLCHRHVPDWLATAGMTAEKIARFYDDPAKQACDAEALRLARYRRNLVVETTLGWRAHRLRVALQNRLQNLLRDRQSGRVRIS